ncbi:unnamed protein product, partial [Ectocarpus sp. 8 AP-2014]
IGENSTVPQTEPIMFEWVDVIGRGAARRFYFFAVVGTCFSPSALL